MIFECYDVTNVTVQGIRWMAGLQALLDVRRGFEYQTAQGCHDWLLIRLKRSNVIVNLAASALTACHVATSWSSIAMGVRLQSLKRLPRMSRRGEAPRPYTSTAVHG